MNNWIDNNNKQVLQVPSSFCHFFQPYTTRFQYAQHQHHGKINHNKTKQATKQNSCAATVVKSQPIKETTINNNNFQFLNMQQQWRQGELGMISTTRKQTGRKPKR
jgi:hypothetical protein